MTAPGSDLNAADPTVGFTYTQLINYYLQQWGLNDLAPTVTALGKDPANNADSIYLQLQQTPEWHQRFAGNDLRLKAGLSVLSPAQYLGLEDSYRSTLQQYGLPAGFYDDDTSISKWIGMDVSPSELAARANQAATLVYNSPPEAQKAWDQYYGGGPGGAIASILDPTVAEPLVQQHVAAAQIGGAAMQQGLNTAKDRAELFASQGVSLDQARQAYSSIAQRLPTDQAISNRFSNTATGQFGQTQEENATLLGTAADITKQQTLYSEEKGEFSGHGGATDASFNPGANY